MVGHGGSSASSYLADPTSPATVHQLSWLALLRVNWAHDCLDNSSLCVSNHHSYFCEWYGRPRTVNNSFMWSQFKRYCCFQYDMDQIFLNRIPYLPIWAPALKWPPGLVGAPSQKRTLWLFAFSIMSLVWVPGKSVVESMGTGALIRGNTVLASENTLHYSIL